MRHLYIAEIYRNGAIFVADSTGLSSFTSAQRAPEKKLYMVRYGRSTSSTFVAVPIESPIGLPGGPN